MVRLLMYLLALGCLTTASATDNRIDILVLHSYHQGYKWTDDIQRGIAEELASGRKRVFLNIQYMDSKRFNQTDYFLRLAELYRYKYSDKSFDVIIASDDNALNFLLAHRNALFGQTPVVFCGVNYLQPERLADHSGFTGVNEQADIEGGIRQALLLHPATDNLMLITDTTTTGQRILAEYNKVSRQLPATIKVTIQADTSAQQLIDRAASLSPDSLIYYSFFFRDNRGRFFEYDQILKRLREATTVPIYGAWDFSLGDGIVGGLLTSGLYQGKTAAGMARQVIEGTRVDDIPLVLNSPNRFMFDYQQLQQRNIPHSQLPENSVIINQPLSVYESHRLTIWVVLTLVLVLLMVIITQRFYIRRQHRIEQALTRHRQQLAQLNNELEQRVQQRTQDLADSNNQLQQSLSDLQTTQKQLVESEKLGALGSLVVGMAHELNTPIGVSLTAITTLRAATDELDDSYQQGKLSRRAIERYQQDTIRGQTLLETNLKRTAELINFFKQVAIDPDGEPLRRFNLAGHLRHILKATGSRLARHGHQVTIDCPDDLDIDSYPGAYYQLFNQLLDNSLRHGFPDGAPGQIHIGVTLAPPHLHLIYQDDGIGLNDEIRQQIFDPFYTTKRSSGSSGLGMHIVYNLVTRLLAGQIRCDNGDMGGFQVQLTLPLLAKRSPATG